MIYYITPIKKQSPIHSRNESQPEATVRLPHELPFPLLAQDLPLRILPQELSDHIISFLQYDPPSLKHCSLVCHAWLDSSRVYLFRCFRMNAVNAVYLAGASAVCFGNTSAGYLGAGSLGVGGTVQQQQKQHSVLPLGKSTSISTDMGATTGRNTITPYVKRLSIHEAHLFFMKITSPSSSSFSCPTAASSPSSTPYVSSPSTSSSPPPSTFTFFHTLFSHTLTHIHISHTFLDSFVTLVDVLCALEKLKSVELEHVAWNGTCSMEEAKKIGLDRRRPCISGDVESLKFKHTPLGQIMVWLRAQSVAVAEGGIGGHETQEGSVPGYPRITHFEADPIEEKEVPHVGRYFTVIGASAKYVSLSFGVSEYGYTHLCPYEPKMPPTRSGCTMNSSDTSDAVIKEKEMQKSTSAMNLYTSAFGIPICSYMSSFTTLETVRIEGFLDTSLLDETQTQTTALFWTPRILGSISSTRVSRVILQVRGIERAGDLDRWNVNWEFIDQMLCMTETYRALKRLDFEVVVGNAGGRNRVDLDGIGSLVSHRLPMLAKRDMLGFYKA